jgi:hypothetical protein
MVFGVSMPEDCCPAERWASLVVDTPGRIWCNCSSLWGCTILANDLLAFPDFYARYGVTKVGLEELLRLSDIVMLHVPLDDLTRNILSLERLGLMKPTAVLINAARGGLVDEAVLKTMLMEKPPSGGSLGYVRYGTSTGPGTPLLTKLPSHTAHRWKYRRNHPCHGACCGQWTGSK